MADYPECERMTAIAEESHKLGDFLDWLNEQGIHLCELQTQIAKDCSRCGGGGCDRCDGGYVMSDLITPRYMSHNERYEELLARFFDIDLNKVEKERRAMLKELQAKANA